jgi:hypothetical protein
MRISQKKEFMRIIHEAVFLGGINVIMLAIGSRLYRFKPGQG